MRREKKSSEEEAPKGRFHSELFDWGEALILSLTIVILVFVFGIRIIGVEGSSMVPTLQNGNQLLVSNLFYTPEKGDIVILTKDSFMTSPIVKRVIATESDTVDIDFTRKSPEFSQFFKEKGENTTVLSFVVPEYRLKLTAFPEPLLPCRLCRAGSTA